MLTRPSVRVHWVACLYVFHNTNLRWYREFCFKVADSWSLVPHRVKPKNDSLNAKTSKALELKKQIQAQGEPVREDFSTFACYFFRINGLNLCGS